MDPYVCNVCGGRIDRKGFCEVCGTPAGSAHSGDDKPGDSESLQDISSQRTLHRSKLSVYTENRKGQ